MTIRDIAIAFGFEIDKNSEKKVENGIKGIKNMATTLLGAIGIGFSIAGLSNLAEAAANVVTLKSQFSQVFGNVEEEAQNSLQAVSDYAGAVTNRMKGSFTQIAAFAKTTMDPNDLEAEAKALEIAERGMRAVADSSAFYDRSLEDVTASLQSLLKGNYENDAALGFSCTEITRNTAANKLYGKSFKDLSEYQKQLTLLQMVEDANKASGAFEQANRESNTWTNQLGNLKQSLTDLKAAIGGTFLEPAIAGLKMASSLVQKATGYINELNSETGFLTRSYDKFNALIKRIQPTAERMTKTLYSGIKKGIEFAKGLIERFGGIGNILKVLTLAAGAFALVINWKKMTGAAKSFVQMLSGIGKMFNMASLKVMALVAVLVVLALIVEDFIHFLMGNDSVIGTIFDNAGIGADNARKAIMDAFAKVKEFLIGVWDFLKQAAGMWIGAIRGFFEKNGESIRANFERYWGIIRTFLKGVWTFLSQLASTLFGKTEDSIDGSTKSTKDTLLGIWQSIISALSAGWNAIYSVASSIFNALASVVEKVFSAIQTFWSIWGDDILRWFKNTFDNLKGVFSGFLQVVQGIANLIAAIINGDWKGAWEAAKQIVMGAFQIIISLASQFINNIKVWIDMLLTAIATMGAGIKNKVVEIKDSIVNGILEAVNWIKSLPAEAVQWGSDLITGMVDGIKGAVGKVKEAVLGIAEDITSYLHFSVPDKGPLTEYESWMPDFMQGLADGIDGSKTTVLDRVRGLASEISMLMKSATAQPMTAAMSAGSSYSSSVTQNVSIANSYTGGSVEAQKSVSKAMNKSASDATDYMARALAYARG